MAKRGDDGPPQDGQTWIRANEAADMMQMCLKYFRAVAKSSELTVFRARGNAPYWYLRSEIDAWAEFRRMRRAWCRKYAVKGRYPRYTEKMDLTTARRLFIGTKEAAAMLGVCRQRISDLVHKGRLVSYQAHPGHRGSALWFSRRAVELLSEEPERIKALEIRARGRQTNPPRKTSDAARHLRGVEIPAGWLTIAEVAQRLGVNRRKVENLRQRGRLRGERLWRRNKWLKYWYIPEWEVERLEADPDYQRLHAAAKARQAAQANPIDKIKIARPTFTVCEEDMTQVLKPMLESKFWQLPPEPTWGDGKPSPWGR